MDYQQQKQQKKQPKTNVFGSKVSKHLLKIGKSGRYPPLPPLYLPLPNRLIYSDITPKVVEVVEVVTSLKNHGDGSIVRTDFDSLPPFCPKINLFSYKTYISWLVFSY